MNRTIVALTIAFALAGWIVAEAQVGDGSIFGTVTDADGKVITDVKITLSGEGLMGERITTSGAQGAYRIINLPPGFYKLTVSKTNYQTMEFPNIRVRAGKDSSFNITLKTGVFEDTIVIVDENPVIDTTSPGLEFQIEGKFLTSLPISATGQWYQVMQMLPGTVMRDGVDSETPNFAVMGAGLNLPAETHYSIDGAQANDIYYGHASVTSISPDIIDDINIQLSGTGADSPIGLGGRVSVVTKSGGNDLSGIVTYYAQPKQFNDSNEDGGTAADSVFYQGDISVGGPIIKDHLWFFASTRITESNWGISRTQAQIDTLNALFPGQDNTPRGESSDRSYFVKGTYKVNDANTLFFSLQDQWGTSFNVPASWAPSAAYSSRTEGPLMNLNLDTFVNDDLTVRTQVSYQSKKNIYEGLGGNNPNQSIYGKSAIVGGYRTGQTPFITYAGNSSLNYDSDRILWTAKSDANLFIEDFHGSHELKFGIYLQPKTKYNYREIYNRSPAIEHLVLLDPNDYSKGMVPFYRLYRLADEAVTKDVGTENYAAYVDDRWQMSERLTLALGLRVDWVKGTNNTYEVVTLDDIAVSPRAGFTYRLTDDGKQFVRASAGMLYKAYTPYYMGGSNINTVGQRKEYDNDLDGVFETVVVTPGAAQANGWTKTYSEVDLSLPYSYDLTAGYSIELPWRILASVDYAYRANKNDFISVNVNPIYQNGQFVGLNDPTVTTITQKVNDTWRWVQYQSIAIQFNKSLSNNVQMLASYSYDWQDIKGTWNPYDPWGYIQPDAFETHVDDYYRGTRGHVAKFNAVWHAPWDILASVSYSVQGGYWSGPIYRNLDPNDPEVLRFGPQYIVINGRNVTNPLFKTQRFAFATRGEGQWQGDPQQTMAIRLGRVFRYDRYSFEVDLDVHNVFNWAGGVYNDSRGNILDSEQYKNQTPLGTQPPRAGKITLKFTF